MVNIKEKLIEIQDEWYNTSLGEMPENEIEREIFAEIDMTGAFIYAELSKLKSNNLAEWNDKILNESVETLKKLIKDRGEKEFHKNKVLYNYYLLCMKAAKLMDEFKKIKNENKK